MTHNGDQGAKPSFMEDLCMTLDPNLNMRTGCIIWFQQAITHCAKLLMTIEPTKPTFLEKIGNIFQSDVSDDIDMFSDAASVRMNPELMTVEECKALYVDAIKDYVAQAPFYTPEAQFNTQFWFIVNLLMWIFPITALLFGSFFVYRNFSGSKREQEVRYGREVREVREVGAIANSDVQVLAENHGGAEQHMQNKSVRIVTSIPLKIKRRTTIAGRQSLDSIVTSVNSE